MRVIRRLGDGAHNDCVIDDDGDGDGEYDLEFHIASVFILLFVSFVGAAFSVVTARVRCLRVSPIAINIGKFFGSGVVLATGFIHMLTSGMEALTNPCLPESWNAYGAYAGLFAMIAALAMHLIEFIAQQRSLSPGQGESTPLLDDKSIRYRQPEQIEISQTSHGHSHNLPFQDSSQNHKISTYLLEFGIALHSVLIGLALGTTTDSFEALLIALTFHQFFEAIALGAQIARVEHMSCSSTAFMVIFFSITTPLGIGIGIGIHTTTYDPDSASSLLINGIFDAISGGILIYVALVNLISAEMGPNAREFHSSSRGLKFVYFLALYTGAGAMAVIGLWA